MSTVVEVDRGAELPKQAAKGHPSGDNRFKLLEATMKRHQYQSGGERPAGAQGRHRRRPDASGPEVDPLDVGPERRSAG